MELSELLLPRPVAALYSHERMPDRPSISVDLPDEYRIVGERGAEVGARRHGGTYESVRWSADGELDILWSTNSAHAVHVDAAVRAPISAATPEQWRHPSQHGVDVDVPHAFRVQRDDTTCTIVWGESLWMAAERGYVGESWITMLTIWLPYSVEDIVTSRAQPPGPVGLVRRR